MQPSLPVQQTRRQDKVTKWSRHSALALRGTFSGADTDFIREKFDRRSKSNKNDSTEPFMF